MSPVHKLSSFVIFVALDVDQPRTRVALRLKLKLCELSVIQYNAGYVDDNSQKWTRALNTGKEKHGKEETS